MKIARFARRSIVALALVLSSSAFAQKNVLQPGDPLIASSSNSPGSEGVANAIDGKTTKYLNFDSRTPDPIKPSGFIVTPSIGVTRVTGMRIQSANDAQERDPKTVILEGSNDAAVTAFGEGTWEAIATLDVPDFTARFQWQQLSFPNLKAYKHYRWTVTQTRTSNGCCMQVAEVELLGKLLSPDVTQPGDALIASSSNSPGSEGVANAIDNKTTKYLNFDSRTPEPIKESGFVVTPAIGRTVLDGMTIQSANDAQERDPKTVILEGSNDDTVTGYNAGNWTEIQTITVPDFTARFQTQTILFDNVRPYKHYRWRVTATRTANGCCMQVAEVELLGTGAPKDITQPGDALIASSSNSPGSEGVANVIDNKTTKYLNFDSRTPDPIKPSGFIVTPAVGATTVTGMTIQSANDAQERDPKTVILEGSNDETVTAFNEGTWEAITTLEVPDFTARFQTQEMFFANSKAYKHYRWTVTQTRTSNGCCMQVAEVELLAVTEGADCNKARFVQQPVNTPVLDGNTATFITIVNGPWPLQWLKNGQPIPGATASTYTTAAITAANASDVYAVQIVGCEKSADVQAVIFRPSDTKSIAVSFDGGGANGAPTLVRADDILGIHLQAHWNNATAADGSFPLETEPFLDSDGNPTDITLTFDTGGEWGAGTGDLSATDRMLNGLVGRNAPGTESTFIYGGVPAGSHSVIIYSVSPPLQFQVNRFTIGEQTYFMRSLNSDEYNAAPGFYRGSATTQAGATIGNFIRFDNVRPDEAGQIILAVECMTPGVDRETGVNGIQLVLNTGAAGNPPVITVDPQPTVSAANATARLSVTATGDAPLTYQWRKNGRNISNGGNISGATSATLSITEFSAADVGVYSVAVFNNSGSVISKNAAVDLATYSISDRLVAHWKMDETGGTTVDNAVAGGSDGEITGAGTFGAGKIGNALTLDGNSYVFVPNFTKAKQAIAGSAWVFLDPNIGGDVVVFRNAQGDMTVSGGASRVVGQFEVGFVADINDLTLRPMATVGLGPNIARATGTAAVATGAWHHIAFSADGAQLRVYLDGAQVAAVDYLAEINTPDINYISMGAQLNLADPLDPASLGLDATTPKLLLGSLDDVALWTRALSAKEVELIYAAGQNGQALNTVVVPRPTVEPRLTVSRVGNTVTVIFDGGALQSAPAVEGPWTAVTNPTQSPYSEQSTSAATKFFRAVVPQ